MRKEEEVKGSPVHKASHVHTDSGQRISRKTGCTFKYLDSKIIYCWHAYQKKKRIIYCWGKMVNNIVTDTTCKMFISEPFIHITRDKVLNEITKRSLTFLIFHNFDLLSSFSNKELCPYWKVCMLLLIARIIIIYCLVVGVVYYFV